MGCSPLAGGLQDAHTAVEPTLVSAAIVSMSACRVGTALGCCSALAWAASPHGISPMGAGPGPAVAET